MSVPIFVLCVPVSGFVCVSVCLSHWIAETEFPDGWMYRMDGMDVWMDEGYIHPDRRHGNEQAYPNLSIAQQLSLSEPLIYSHPNTLLPKACAFHFPS